eukprot:TRINITY_DN22107_c0_g1_i2.p1 TRINITY_DN22107_c0_g1~~TRINITY_DN22107_c0_g1_i2.p1  ORF type:complete len:394 (-),score=22.03 TRINITY_DN22107_c0_g1_i2:510-1553(-)
MNTPSMMQWRCSVTLWAQSCDPNWTAKNTELAFILLFEGLPATATLVYCLVIGMVAAVDDNYDAIFHFALRGAVILMVLLAGLLLAARMYLQGAPERERQLFFMSRSVDHLGRLWSVVGKQAGLEDPLQSETESDSENPRRFYGLRLFAACIFLDFAGLFAFHVRHHFDTLLLGQLVITVVAAYGFYSSFPRQLGRTFWGVFILFYILTFALWLFTHAGMQGTALAPLCLGPTAEGYNDDMASMPLDSSSPREQAGYPVCNQRWGHSNMTADEQLNVFDLAALAFASSYPQEEQVRANLHEVFDGTALGTWNLTYVAPSAVVGRWIVVDFPLQRTRVVAVRGTSTVI